MYARPTPRPKFTTPLNFVTEVRGSGARTAQWVPADNISRRVPNGTPGRVGEIIDTMRRGEACIARSEQKPWKPSIDYELIAKHMHEAEREAYITRCKEWFAANPLAAKRRKSEASSFNIKLIEDLFTKYSGQAPPFEERMQVYRDANVPEAYIAKAIARHEHFEATSDERQRVLDAIFPNVPKKSEKPKPKVIKAVKKKMV